MITSSNHAGIPARFARLAAYVGYLLEDMSTAHAIESHHFEYPPPASRGLKAVRAGRADVSRDRPLSARPRAIKKCR